MTLYINYIKNPKPHMQFQPGSYDVYSTHLSSNRSAAAVSTDS